MTHSAQLLSGCGHVQHEPDGGGDGGDGGGGDRAVSRRAWSLGLALLAAGALVGARRCARTHGMSPTLATPKATSPASGESPDVGFGGISGSKSGGGGRTARIKRSGSFCASV